MKYYKQLDGLRAIAIIGVMIAHWLQSSMKIEVLKNIPYGTGVTLFFVLSGFLITKILLDFKERNTSQGISHFKSIKSFYIRRSLRIFPIYYLTIFFLLIIGFGNTAELFPWLATYTTNVYMAIHSNYIDSFTHFWSLAVEEQFYLFWVFVIVYVSNRYLKKTIVAFIIASILILYFLKFYTGYWLSNGLVICQMHTLGAGALLAYYVKYESEKINRISLSTIKGILLVITLIFTLVFVYRKPDPLYETLRFFQDPAVTVIYFFVVLIAIREGFTGIIKRILENKVMLYIGRISYGLYIYHLFMGPLFINVINKYLKIETTNFGHFIIFFFLDLIIASLSWYLIEKPINGLKKYYKY